MSGSVRDTVHAWFERVWNAGEESAIEELFSPDGIAHGLPTSDGLPMRGVSAFKPFFLNFRSAFPDIRVKVVHTVTEGSLCAVYTEVTGTHSSPALGFPATLRKVSFTGMTLVRVEGGQIQEGWNSYDFLSLYQQLGLLPDMESASSSVATNPPESAGA